MKISRDERRLLKEAISFYARQTSQHINEINSGIYKKNLPDDEITVDAVNKLKNKYERLWKLNQRIGEADEIVLEDVNAVVGN